MSKYLSTIALMVTLSTNIYSQNVFSKGYIIKSNGDSISGFILKKIDSDLAQEVTFRNLEDAKNQIYNVSDLQGFGFNNGRTFDRMRYRNESGDSTAIFSKKILTGKINVWIWRKDKKDSDFFLKNKSNSKYVHLYQTKNMDISKDGKNYIQNDNRHIGLLQYVTNNDLKFTQKKREIAYSEKNITHKIAEYNQKFSTSYSTERYNDEIEMNHHAFLGYLITKNTSDAVQFKLGYFRRETNVEKNQNFSIIRGITYQGWHKLEEWDGVVENGESNHRWQLFNFLPWGFYYQGNQPSIKPYGYMAFGLGVLALSDYQIVDSKNTGSKTSFIAYPTVYAGVGMQYKMSKNYLFTEFTPSIWGSSISLGFGF